MSEMPAATTGLKIAVALPCAKRSAASAPSVATPRYANGITANTSPPAMRNGRRPATSDHAPAGSLSRTPVIVDAPTIRPSAGALAPRSRASSWSSGVRQMA